MDAETALRLIGLLLALGLAFGGLRAARRHHRDEKQREDSARRDRNNKDYGGPWGGG